MTSKKTKRVKNDAVIAKGTVTSAPEGAIQLARCKRSIGKSLSQGTVDGHDALEFSEVMPIKKARRQRRFKEHATFDLVHTNVQQCSNDSHEVVSPICQPQDCVPASVVEQSINKLQKNVVIEKDSSVSEDESVGVADHEDLQPELPLGAFADVLSRILKKKVPSSNVILSKCETDRQRTLKTLLKATNEADGNLHESNVVRVKVKQASSCQLRSENNRREDLFRVKPNIFEKEQERNLQRVATKGVVQLFNAVHKHQATLQGKLRDVGASENKREKVIQTLTKSQFINLLKPVKAEKTPCDEIKTEQVDPVNAAASSWSVLRDDFMFGASMKDWDRQNIDSD